MLALKRYIILLSIFVDSYLGDGGYSSVISSSNVVIDGT